LTINSLISNNKFIIKLGCTIDYLNKRVY